MTRYIDLAGDGCPRVPGLPGSGLPPLNGPTSGHGVPVLHSYGDGPVLAIRELARPASLAGSAHWLCPDCPSAAVAVVRHGEVLAVMVGHCMSCPQLRRMLAEGGPW